MPYPDYNNHGRSSRPSPPGVDSHRGSSYAEQVPNKYQNPYPTQNRSTHVPYQQSYYSVAQQQMQSTYPTYPSYNAPSDPRYHSGQQYGSYTPYRASPSSGLVEPWRNPQPPRDDRWQGSQYYSAPTDLQAQHTPGAMRSPNTAYFPQATSNYPQYQSLTSAAYPVGHGLSRGVVTSVATTTPHYHHQPSMSMTHAPSDRQVPSSRAFAPPYARPAMSPVDPESQSEAIEPAIKKKRNRADAHQLEALNSTYTPTAFPSTEERAQLAKDLDMSPRSVQIWFQNKRQTTRRDGRDVAAASSGPPEPTSILPVARNSPVLVSPLVETSGSSYSSRSPPPAGMRSGQTPSSPPSGAAEPTT